MRFRLINLALCCAVATSAIGCATKRCLEGYGTMASDQIIRQDGQMLTGLVERRQGAAQALQAMGDQSSQSGDLHRSVQALEMAMALVVQLQNLSRREEHASNLLENRELTARIRCLAADWASRDDHIIGGNEGMRMLGHQRELEEIFGD